MKRALVWLSTVAVVMMLQPRVGPAQTPEDMQQLRKDLEGVKKGQESIQKELQEIKKLLQARPTAQRPQPQPFKPLDISIAGDPVKGHKDAKLVLVEFSDFE